MSAHGDPTGFHEKETGALEPVGSQQDVGSLLQEQEGELLYKICWMRERHIYRTKSFRSNLEVSRYRNSPSFTR